MPKTTWPGQRTRPSALRAGVVLLQLALGAAAAVALFNYVIMPRFVHHGNETEVPALEGRTLAEAAAMLHDAGLTVRDTLARTNPDSEPGEVLEQIPRAGMRVKPERGVALVVSAGQTQTTVPSLTGQTLRFARLLLGQEGYGLGDVIRRPMKDYPRNTVISSDPPHGSRAPQGARVHLLVSDGPPAPDWVMPDLRGKDLLITADRLRFAGFPVKLEREEGGFGLGRVRSTYPYPGARVAAGDTLLLVGD